MDKTRFIQGAIRYAAADRSDPFTLARALTHVANGVAGFRHDDQGNRINAYYDAKPTRAQRKLDDGTVYEIPAYESMVRP